MEEDYTDQMQHKLSLDKISRLSDPKLWEPAQFTRDLHQQRSMGNNFNVINLNDFHHKTYNSSKFMAQSEAYPGDEFVRKKEVVFKSSHKSSLSQSEELLLLKDLYQGMSSRMLDQRASDEREDVNNLRDSIKEIKDLIKETKEKSVLASN